MTSGIPTHHTQRTVRAWLGCQATQFWHGCCEGELDGVLVAGMSPWAIDHNHHPIVAPPWHTWPAAAAAACWCMTSSPPAATLSVRQYSRYQAVHALAQKSKIAFEIGIGSCAPHGLGTRQAGLSVDLWQHPTLPPAMMPFGGPWQTANIEQQQQQ